MAKMNVIETAKSLEDRVSALFESVNAHQSVVKETLQNVRVSERALMDKERVELQAKLERERKERLMQVLASDKDLAVHIGGDDFEREETAIEPVVQTDTPNVTAVQEEPAVQAQHTIEAVQTELIPHEHTEKPSLPPQTPTVAAVPEEKPREQGYQQHTINQQMYQRQPQQGYQQRPQQGGAFQQRPQQGNTFQQRPQQGGGTFQQRPQQGGGTFQQRPQQGSGTFQQRPQQGGGTFQQRPQQGGGTFQQRPQQGGGAFQQRPQQGGGTFQQRPQQGGGTFQQRPQQGGGFTPGTGPRKTPGSVPTAATSTKDKVSNYDPNRGNYTKNYEADKRARNKKAIQKEAAPMVRWDDDTPMGSTRRRPRKPQIQRRPEPVVIEKAVFTTEMVTVKDLSEKLGKPAGEIIKKLFMLGIIATINQELDFDTVELIASDYGIEVDQQIAKTFEEVLQDRSDEEDEPDMLIERPPVVTIMGHVDHGKTSLLDAIRQSKMAEGEAGGITQHIGAYTVELNGRSITFIDTPGHEAFTSMRARGAQVTDIVILVVAADDGIMPQTVEAINHAQAAAVPIIVAINKMDRAEADPERIKQQLTEYSLVTEEWGGETICAPVSAKTREGLDHLLEMVLLQADVLELKANPNRLAKGTIVEAQLDKGRGPVATVLIQNGTLHVGDPIVAGTTYGRVRAMMDDKGHRVKEAGPSQPVEVLGFSEVPAAGDILNVAEIDKLSRQVAEERRDKIKAEQLKNLSKVSLDDLFNQIAEGEIKDLNIIVKADVQGSVEAVKQALEKLSKEEVRVRCIHGGVGAITGSDIMFASASNAIIIGFNVRMDASARQASEREKVDVRMYSIIYNAIADVESAMKGLFKPVFKEVELGRISVRETFRVSGVGTIAGAYVQEGKVNRNAQIRVVRDGIVIHEGKISSLKRFKDDAKEVATGYECGIGVENFNDLLTGDIIEAFEMEEIKR